MPVDNGAPVAVDNGTVTVACKLPNGLVLRTFDMITKWDDGGKKNYEEARQRPETFTIAGAGNPIKPRKDGVQIVGGYAITHNVPAAIWNEWAKDNKESDFIKNRLVFAMANPRAAEDKAKNNAKMARTGLEPLNPDKIIKDGRRIPADPRIPHAIDPASADEIPA